LTQASFNEDEIAVIVKKELDDVDYSDNSYEDKYIFNIDKIPNNKNAEHVQIISDELSVARHYVSDK
jgi:hypothetical protein